MPSKKLDWDRPIRWSDGLPAEIVRKEQYGRRSEYCVARVGERHPYLVSWKTRYVGTLGYQYGDAKDKRGLHVVNCVLDPTLEELGLVD